MSEIKLTTTAAAREFGASRDTLQRGLSALGLEVGKGATFTLRQIHRALAGDLRAERTRLSRELANRAERENRLADADLVKMSECEAHIMQVLVNPVRAAFEALPAATCQLLNPTDPAAAHAILQGYIERTIKPALREKLSAPGTTKQGT
jgi:hypothetical protein